MARPLFTLVLLYCCCVPAVGAISWSRVTEKANELLRPEQSARGNTTSVYKLLEDLYYLDESVAELWQAAKVALFAITVVLFLAIVVPIWVILYRLGGAIHALKQLSDAAKKRQ